MHILTRISGSRVVPQVSYEYIASQRNKDGVLILSEFAGAAQSFNGALIVNPWNTDQLVNTIYEALVMDEGKRAANYDNLNRYLGNCSSENWGRHFVNELKVCTGSSIVFSFIINQ